MSDSIFRIWSIARYEAKVIMRGWTFRIALLVNVAALIAAYLMHSFVMHGAPMFYPGFPEVPSSYPYISLLYSNIIIAVAVALISADSISRDNRLDSNEAVFTRDFCVLEYLAGKTAGLSLAFLTITGAVLAITFIYNLVFTGAVISFSAYYIYPLLICLPSFFFFAGSAALLQAVTGNKALTLIGILGLMALFVVVGADRFFYTFDAAAFRIPLLLSEYTGLASPLVTIVQRSAFLLGGAAMILGSFLLLRRPRQSRLASSVMMIFMPVLAISSIALTVSFVKYHNDGKSMRAEMMGVAHDLRDELLVTPESFDIDLIHHGNDLDITTTAAIRNDTEMPLERYLFNLNPGLEVHSVRSKGRDLRFSRSLQVIEIAPVDPLLPGGRDTVTVTCEGTIEDRACFPDADESVRWKGFGYRDEYYFNFGFRHWFKYSRFQHRKQFSFVSDEFLLLPPHAMWYPAPGLVRGSQDPGLEHIFFADHRIRITADEGLVAVSQGPGGRDPDGAYRFLPEDQLPGATVAIGNYSIKSMEIDSVTYSLATLCPDEYFMDYFEEYIDTIPSLIREMREYTDAKAGLEYPFSRLSVIEIPVDYYCFTRPLVTNGREYVQPGLILAPERGAFWSIYYLNNYMGRMYRDFRDKEDPSVRCARNFKSTIRNSIINNPKYSPLNLYYSGVFNLGSTGNSSMNHALESHFAERFVHGIDIDSPFRPGTGRLARTIAALDGTDLPTLLADRSRYDEALSALPLKGKQLFIELQGLVGELELDMYLSDVLSRNQGQVLHEDEFIEDFKDAFGTDIRPVIERWYHCRELPGFIIDDIDWYSIDDNGIEKYQFRMVAYNREKTPGIIRVSVPPSRKRGSGWINGQTAEYIRTFLFEPGEALEIGVVTGYKPRTAYVNTLIAKNLPPVTQYRMKKFEKREHERPFNGKRSMDPARFAGPKNVHIIDNADPGFEVVSDPEQSWLSRTLNRFRTRDSSGRYVYYVRHTPPLSWKETVHKSFYGPYTRTAHFIAAGNGEGRVRWTVDIPESGTYEIYYYMADCFDKVKPKQRKKMAVNEYHFSVSHDEGIDDPVMAVFDCIAGWNLLGTYYFSKGKAEVELTDESPKYFILADAVKWVKKD